MTLGEKLRAARLEAGITQRQLCGDTITRNMLSQIENGSAKPSMQTLQYLAKQLGRPMSWFLEEDGAISPNLQVILAAREAYGDWEKSRQILQSYREPDILLDPEYRLLLQETLLSLAEEAALTPRSAAHFVHASVYTSKHHASSGLMTPPFTKPPKRALPILPVPITANLIELHSLFNINKVETILTLPLT